MTVSYDDLGEAGGRFEFPHGGLAKAAVMDWAIADFGNRPGDYLARDLMLGSFERDRRQWKYRMLCKHKPPWMFEDTLGFADGKRMQIAQQRSFHLLHQAHWLDLLDRADDQARRVISQLRQCWPAGSLVTWNGDDAEPRGNCRHVHHCPFCFARKACQLYDSTIQALPPEPGQRGFLLLTATLTDAELQEAGIENAYDFVRSRVLPAIQDALKSLGAHGGLSTSQIGPHLRQSRSWDNGELAISSQTGFEYQVGVLGEFEITPSCRARLQLLGGAPPVAVGGVTLCCHMSVVNHVSNNSLRILLAGHRAAYTGNQRLEDGRGLFGWPSLILANYGQWRERLDLVRNRHLYDRWGTWIGMPTASRQPHLPMGRRVRTGRARQLDILRNGNNRRQRQVKDRVDQIMQESGELLRQLATETGRPPGRSRILAILEQEGIEVTDKDSRRLAKILKLEAQR